MDLPRVCCGILATHSRASVLAADRPAASALDVIVVLGPGVESEPFRQRFRAATLVVAGRPGWAAAANAALEQALVRGADYLLLADSGAHLSADLALLLVGQMEGDAGLAAIGVKNVLRDDPSTTWGRYGRITWGPGLIAIDRQLEPAAAGVSTRQVDWVLGNGCMLRTAHARQIGPFDEDLFAGFAEADWCIRARRAGFGVAYAGGCEVRCQPPVERFGAARFLSSPSYLVGRSTMVFARKHAGWPQWAKLVTCMGIGVALRLLWYVGEGAEDTMRIQWPFVSGMHDGFRRRLRKGKIAIRRDRGTLRVRCRRFVDWIGA